MKLYCISKDPSDDARCVVCLTGAVDSFTSVDLFAEKTRGTERMSCHDDETGPEKLGDITLEWIEQLETYQSFATMLIIWGAIKSAYSC